MPAKDARRRRLGIGEIGERTPALVLRRRSHWQPVCEHLLFDNGLGGFTPDGREYVIPLRGGERPPAPWSNVLANPDFGCLVTEAGGGYTWAGNSQMNRLTPWSNDPVSDPPGEVVYLRDEETRGVLDADAGAVRAAEATTVVRHGQGLQPVHSNQPRPRTGPARPDFADRAGQAVSPARQEPGRRPRRLSATFYAEWVVGHHREQAPLQVVCTVDTESGALFATNAWAGEFAGRVAFADVAVDLARSPPIAPSSSVARGRQRPRPLSPVTALRPRR